MKFKQKLENIGNWIAFFLGVHKGNPVLDDLKNEGLYQDDYTEGGEK